MDLSVVISHAPTKTSGVEVWHTIHSLIGCIEGTPYANSEIIVSDNTDKDPVPELAKLRDMGIIKLVQCPELSTSKVRNVGWLASAGKHVLFLDCHVILPSNFITSLMKTMADKNFSILHGYTEFWGNSGSGFYSYNIDFSSGISASNNQTPASNYSPYLIPASGYGAVLFKREVLETIGGFMHEQIGWGGEELPVSLLAGMYGFYSGIDPKIKHFHYDAMGKRRNCDMSGNEGYNYILNNLLANYVLGGEVWLEKNYKFWLDIDSKVVKGMDYKALDLGKTRRDKVVADNVVTLEELEAFWIEFQVPYRKNAN